MRTHSRTVLLAVALAIAGLGASCCSKIGMLKGQMAFKDANAAYAASGLQEGHREVPGGARRTTRSCPTPTSTWATATTTCTRWPRRASRRTTPTCTKAVEYYKQATEKITEPKLRKLSFEYLLNCLRPRQAERSVAGRADRAEDDRDGPVRPGQLLRPRQDLRGRRQLRAGGSGAAQGAAMPIRRTRPSTCRWRPSTTARDASTRRWKR